MYGREKTISHLILKLVLDSFHYSNPVLRSWSATIVGFRVTLYHFVSVDFAPPRSDFRIRTDKSEPLSRKKIR